MKKLTAGIFATILGVTAMGAADAAVTSKGYVDAALATKANASEVSTLSSTVADHTTAIAGLQEADTTLQNNINAVAGDVEALETGKQNVLQGTMITKVGDGNVVSEITAADGAITYTTASVATSEGLSALTTRVGTAENAIDAIEADYLKAADKADLEGLISAADAKAGAASTVAGQAKTAADGAVATANSASEVAGQAKTTAEGAVATANSASEVAGQAKTAAATADGKAVAAQADATQALADAATAQAAAEAAQATADAAIKAPADCSDPTNMCVLVSNGTIASWQVIANVYPNNNGTLN